MTTPNLVLLLTLFLIICLIVFMLIVFRQSKKEFKELQKRNNTAFGYSIHDQYEGL